MADLVLVRVNRRVSSIRDLEFAVIVGLPELAGPLELDGGQDGAAILNGEDVGHRLGGPLGESGKDAVV